MKRPGQTSGEHVWWSGNSEDVPGDPAKSASAGTTVLGGMTVLSAILAQSLIIVNFP